MEQRAAQLQARLKTVSGFGDLVNAMRGVASSRAQRARAMIDGVNAYGRTVADAMAQALALLPPKQFSTSSSNAPPLLLVFCAEQGFNAGFSERVLAALPTPCTGKVILLGSHGLRLARAKGIEPIWSGPMISKADSAVAASERLRSTLAQTLIKYPSSQVDLVYGRLRSGGYFAVRHSRLLPLDQTHRGPASGVAPLIHLPPEELLDALADEYVAAQLARAILHSHAAENLSRVNAMAAAHENVLRMADALQADERRLRQETITAEIIELAASRAAARGLR